eukprot:TRINITY_DN16010_c0_g1_i3.p1 TRINITY_DN16010_c0_g1~~TRINITY_DN16010_c0_g1_i3.p1  ORF type:complete len:170 (+),score=34.53 TRINITY_DN16010_c0_g1_i3:164-673(+)
MRAVAAATIRTRRWMAAPRSLFCTQEGADKQKGVLDKVFAEGKRADVLGATAGNVVVDGYTEFGFKVNDNLVLGSLLLMPRNYFSWNVDSLADLTKDSLAVLDVVTPVPEIFVLGCGSTTFPVPERVSALFRERGVLLDATDTVSAIQLFNVLNQEGRAVIGGMLPMAV